MADNMDRLILQESVKQTKLLMENNEGQIITQELFKELISISRETLNFFVSVDERESGEEPTFNKDYLTEISKDGNKPPSA